MSSTSLPVLADLHVHTVLSPCAEVEMVPPLIVGRALALDLHLIAICDHNTCANCVAVMRAAEHSGLTVLPGMEAQTAEEVHVLCLFDAVATAMTWQATVYDHLPDKTNPEQVLGGQYVVDASGEFVRTETRLLATSLDLSLEDVVRTVTALGGLAIPAHVDRPTQSLLANLGMVPEGLQVPALELFRRTHPADALAKWPALGTYPLIRGGDAHRLSEIRPAIRLPAQVRTVSDLRYAFAARAFALTP